MNSQNKSQQGSQNLNNLPIYIVGITIGLAFLFTLMVVLSPYFGYNKSPTLLNELSDAGVARGLITFLVVVVVVGIALFLSISAVLVISNKNKGDNVDWDEHFTKAKDVLGLLIGVLGTIVGFYFGQATSEETSPIIALTNAQVEPATVSPDSTFKIKAEIQGGRPPYNYSITFNPDSIKAINKQMNSKKISENFKMPKLNPADTIMKAALTVTDKSGNTDTDTLTLRVLSEKRTGKP